MKIKIIKIRDMLLAGGIILGAAGLPCFLQAQEPQTSEQAAQVDSTGLRLRTALMGAKKTSERKKALISYGEWILQTQNREEARYFMALVSYKDYHEKMEWEAGGYLAAMIGLGIVPVDTAVAVWGGIGCPVDTALSFVKRKTGEENWINVIFNFALYKKIDPLKAVGQMAGTKNPYGLSRAVELVSIGGQAVGSPKEVVDALSICGNRVTVMSELISNENLWKNISYMVGLLDALVGASNQNERPANMERLGEAVYQKVSGGMTKDLARWFVLSQFKNSSGAADQYASKCFLLYGAGLYQSADTVIAVAKNSGSNPENVLQSYFKEYTSGRVGLERYLELVQKCAEFTYCQPEMAVEYMAKTGQKVALEMCIKFIETYKFYAGDVNALSSSLYPHFPVLDVFEAFIKSKIENKTTVYSSFYYNAIAFAKPDEIEGVVARVAKEVDGNYELAREIYEKLSEADRLKAGSFSGKMVGNALKDFDKVWNDWVKNPNSKTEVALEGPLMFLVKNYGSNADATNKLNAILKSDKYSEAQKDRIRRAIEVEARTNREARAALQALDAEINGSQAQQASSKTNEKINKYPSYIQKLGITTFTQLDALENDTLKNDVKKSIKEMAGSITTFESDINKMLEGKKGMERKILIWTIVESVCEGKMPAPVLIAMKLVKDPVFSRQEAEEILAYIAGWNGKNNGGLGVEINETAKWIQENKKNGK